MLDYALKNYLYKIMRLTAVIDKSLKQKNAENILNAFVSQVFFSSSILWVAPIDFVRVFLRANK